ncbi:formin-binding protein 1 [Rhinoderma darwinii]|uniref:formin-binding protein 1 n=1 Tax=Rhinoderma darwinii TaxID=43563 RepID=UPI003F6795A2
MVSFCRNESFDLHIYQLLYPLRLATMLQDQFDNLEKHTQWGIEVLEKYIKFVKERAEIEINYAKQLRNLSKKYQTKKNSKEEEESKYTSCKSFQTTLNEMNDYAGQHEVISENVTSQIMAELTRFVQELKQERKSVSSERFMSQPSCLISALLDVGSDAELAAAVDMLGIVLLLEKLGHHQSSRRCFQVDVFLRPVMAVTQLSQKIKIRRKTGNHAWHEVEINRYIVTSCNQGECHIVTRCKLGEGHVVTRCNLGEGHVVTRCNQGECQARQQAQIRHQMSDDSKGDYSSVLQKFNHEQQEHYHTHIPAIFQKLQDLEERRIARLGDSLKTYAEIDRQVIPIIGKCLDGITKSAESINGKQDSQTVIESYKSGFEPPGDIDFEDFTQSMKRTVSDTSLTNSRADGRSDPKIPSKSRGKLWPFIKKNKGATPEDFSNLPPEQRRKKLQQKVDELNKDLQKEIDQREALTKMKDVYMKNPQMGDPASVAQKLIEIGNNIEKLRVEVQKFEGWLAEVEGRLPARNDSSRRQSGLYETQNTAPVNNCAQDRESSPDGSYTEDQSQETEVKVTPTEFDDDFDDEEPLPTIGTCKALYPFDGENEGTISVAEGEVLNVIEEDKGDGWTRIRRSEEEEGYVPTSYIEVYLDKNAKGAKTYI